MVDPFVPGVVTRRETRDMAKADLFRNRALAAALRSPGAFPVERGRGDVGEAARLVGAGLPGRKRAAARTSTERLERAVPAA